MGIKIKGAEPVDRLRLSVDKMRKIIIAAGVGTIELPGKFAEDLVVTMEDILKDIESLENDLVIRQTETFEALEQVSALKKRLKQKDAAITRMKKLVEES